MSEWIDISKELPPIGERVLVYLAEGTRLDLSGGSRIALDERRIGDGGKIDFFHYYPHNIMLWAHIPEPPK